MVVVWAANNFRSYMNIYEHIWALWKGSVHKRTCTYSTPNIFHIFISLQVTVRTRASAAVYITFKKHFSFSFFFSLDLHPCQRSSREDSRNTRWVNAHTRLCPFMYRLCTCIYVYIRICRVHKRLSGEGKGVCGISIVELTKYHRTSLNTTRTFLNTTRTLLNTTHWLTPERRVK